MAKEKTVVILKPRSVERGLVGTIFERFEKRDLRIVALKFTQPTKELMEQHNEEHRGKHFFDGLIDYMTSGEVVTMVLEGEHAIAAVRKIIGATDPKEADPGTIRGDYGIDIQRNVIQASDSKTAAEREIKLHFPSYYRAKK